MTNDEQTGNNRGRHIVENGRLVEYKLHRLEHHLTISARMLNDFRGLRGLLLDEAPTLASLSQPPAQPLRPNGVRDDTGIQDESLVAA